MIYLQAEFNGRRKDVGIAEEPQQAYNIASNIAQLFSDGSPNPVNVTVRGLSTADVAGTNPIFEVYGYNGYITSKVDTAQFGRSLIA
jgi:hypothetical protein